MQQFKVVPVISSVWTLLHVCRDIQNLNTEFNKQRENGQSPMDLLADLDGLASGFKALSTWYGAYFSEFMKQSLGGHGFLQIAGLTRLHLDQCTAYVTVEGDNTVLIQQTTRWLIKNAEAGKINLDELEFDLNTGKTISKDQEFIMFYEMRFKTSLKKVMDKMDRLMKEKKLT